MAWKEVQAPELPDTFPRPPLVPPGADVAWFELEEQEEARDHDMYVFRLGNGAFPPFVLVVYTVSRDPELGIHWPTFPELWAIGRELVLEGALLSYPAQVVGMDMPDVGAGSIVALTQVGAVRGTPAGARFELAGGRPLDPPPGGIQA